MMWSFYTVADLGGGGGGGGGKGDANATPLAAIFVYITAQVHQMIMQQWHAATTTRHSYTDLQTFD